MHNPIYLRIYMCMHLLTPTTTTTTTTTTTSTTTTTTTTRTGQPALPGLLRGHEKGSARLHPGMGEREEGGREGEEERRIKCEQYLKA